MVNRVNSELPSKAQVVIIGSGVIGAAIACRLVQRGVGSVVILEQGEIGGQGATAKCLGGLRTQFSTAVNIRFSLISRQVFQRFEKTFGIDPGFKPFGYLFLASTQAQWKIFQNTSRLMAAMKAPVQLLEPAEIKRRWPFIRIDDLAGGSYTKNDGFYGPMEVLQGFVTTARRGGANIFENTAVAGFTVSGNRISEVITIEGQRIVADMVVNAAGPWSGQVAALAGLDLPVTPLQRVLFFTDTFEELPGVMPMILDAPPNRD